MICAQPLNQFKSRLRAGMALTTVLIFTAVSLIVIVLGITLMILQVNASLTYTSGQESMFAAESAMENALIRLLRNPYYTGETLTFENGTATITVSGTNPNKQIDVSADVAGSVRNLRVIYSDASGMLEIGSWQEVY